MALNVLSQKDLQFVKNSIANYIEYLDIEDEVVRGHITKLSKFIVFFKITSGFILKTEKNFFLNLISDLYCIIDSLLKKQKRYLYFNERSLIENYLRLLMSTTVEQNHITSQVFEQFLIEYGPSGRKVLTQNDYSKIKSEYKESCAYVHGGDVITDELIFVSDDFLSTKEFDCRSFCEKLIEIITIFNKILLSRFNEEINGQFHRRKSVLEYLMKKSFREELDGYLKKTEIFEREISEELKLSTKLTFQEIILTLQQFWNEQGCLLMQAYDTEKGAGTMSPYTFLRAIGPEPWNAAYVEPSRRPADGRYGENPNRLYQHHQFQVVMKPSPSNIQELYLESLERLGINPLEHDIRFVEDNWENPSTGSAGLGWEVWLDGMEITQFTYFQQVGGLATGPVTAEVTYGLERLASYIQEVDSVYDIEWADGVKYGEIFIQPEYEHSKYSFEVSDQDMLLENFTKFEKEAERALEEGLVHPAFDYVLKCSHTFNLLDARGAVSVTERAGYIARIRNLARVVAKTFVAERKKLGFPLLDEATRAELLKEDAE